MQSQWDNSKQGRVAWHIPKILLMLDYLASASFLTIINLYSQINIILKKTIKSHFLFVLHLSSPEKASQYEREDCNKAKEPMRLKK